MVEPRAESREPGAGSPGQALPGISLAGMLPVGRPAVKGAAPYGPGLDDIAGPTIDIGLAKARPRW